MAELDDFPLEVTLVDGSRWVIYYRTSGTYATTLDYLYRDITEGALLPAENLDRTQRRRSQINAAYIVSVREAQDNHD